MNFGNIIQFIFELIASDILRNYIFVIFNTVFQFVPPTRFSVNPGTVCILNNVWMSCIVVIIFCPAISVEHECFQLFVRLSVERRSIWRQCSSDNSTKKKQYVLSVSFFPYVNMYKAIYREYECINIFVYKIIFQNIYTQRNL